MMRQPFTRKDGVVLQPGDWIQICRVERAETGIGRFSGIWINPTLGQTYSIDFYRSLAAPKDRTALFGNLRGSTLLDDCVRVAGALKPDGTRPKVIEPTH